MTVRHYSLANRQAERFANVESSSEETLKTSRRLARRAARGKTGVPKVAVIYATGEISSGHHEKTGVVGTAAVCPLCRLHRRVH